MAEVCRHAAMTMEAHGLGNRTEQLRNVADQLAAAPPPPAEGARTARLDLSVFDQPGDPRSNMIARGWTPPAEQASGEDAPVAATLADAAADPALTMDAARELLADTARAITAGAYAALSQRPVVDEAMVDRLARHLAPITGYRCLNLYALRDKARGYLTAALAPQQPTGEEGSNTGINRTRETGSG